MQNLQYIVFVILNFKGTKCFVRVLAFAYFKQVALFFSLRQMPATLFVMNKR